MQDRDHINITNMFITHPFAFPKIQHKAQFGKQRDKFIQHDLHGRKVIGQQNNIVKEGKRADPKILIYSISKFIFMAPCINKRSGPVLQGNLARGISIRARLVGSISIHGIEFGGGGEIRWEL